MIDMKLRQVTKLYKRSKATSNKFDGDAMSKNCDVIVTYSIHGQFGAIPKPDSRCIVGKLTVTFYLIKTANITKKSLTQLTNYCFE